MNLEFDCVSKLSIDKKRQVLIDKLSFKVDKSERLSILCPKESQRTQLLHLLTGASVPDTGKVIRNCQMTPPIGETGVFHGQLTIRENLHFICEIYGYDSKTLIPKILEYAEDSIDGNYKFKQLNKIEKRKIGMAMTLAISPDIYIIRGDISFPEKAFKEFFEKNFRRAIKTTSAAITVSQNYQMIRKYFQKCIVVSETGSWESFNDIEKGINKYKSLVE